MIKLKTFIKIIFILLFLPLSSCGLKKSTWEEQGQYTLDDSSANYVWKKGKQYVAVVRTIPVRGRNKNKTIHPVRISPSTIENSFSKIKYKKSKKGSLIRALNNRNVKILSQYLPEALLKAKNKDILFELFQLRKKWWILPTTIDTTAGYIFIEPGRINIIFEKINEDYQGYDYDEARILVGDPSNGIYGGKSQVSKGWIVLTSKSWN
tara:strand:- start:1055 stop:1678 length:624 start_codon:yes stop_codon:yes gene_type:complete